MSYVAELTKNEIKMFVDDFYEIESSRTTKVEIIPQPDRVYYMVVLTSEPVVADLLAATFATGLLNHWEWSKKFNLIE